MTRTDYDAVIAGGGMVGASLALALSRCSNGGLSVLLVESFPLPEAGAAPVYRPSFDARSTALSQGSRQILESVHLWESLSAHTTPITRIHVSDRGHIGSTLMSADEQGWDALGYVVENAWLGSVLLDALHTAPGVECLSPASVTAVEQRAEALTVELERDGETVSVQAALLAVCDGANSGLRERLGIGHTATPYEQSALIANVCFEKKHGGYAYERFTDQGPLALLPLSDSEQREPRAALVWTLPPEQAEILKGADDSEFLKALQQRFGYRQGRFTRVGERALFPLQLVEADEQVRERIVVMGNAAHSLHPVAGQGFNLALRDVWRLAALLGERGEVTLSLLRAYVEAQGDDQHNTRQLSHLLPTLFTQQNPLLSLGRNLGLLALDVLPPVKHWFVDAAAGLAPGNARG